MIKRTPRKRGELSRDSILAAALRLIDAHGLDALNMRELGASLGASTMSVYRYYSNKSELLEAVVDHVVEGFALPAMTGDWQEQARGISLGVRGIMLVHPELADLLGREMRRSPVSLRANTAIVERLRASGVPLPMLPDTYWALLSYTTGYALLEARSLSHKRARPRTADERVGKVRAMLEGIEDISAEAVQEVAVVLARPLDEAQYLFGLDCLIRGLQEQFSAG